MIKPDQMPKTNRKEELTAEERQELGYLPIDLQHHAEGDDSNNADGAAGENPNQDGNGADQGADAVSTTQDGEPLTQQQQTPELPGWASGLPANMRHEELSKYPKLGDFYADAQKWKEAAENSLKVPGEDASEEEVSAYRKALGIPDKPDDYKLPKTELDKQLGTWFKEQAHKAGLSSEQASGLYKALATDYQKGISQQQKQQQEKQEELSRELMDDWGDKYDARLQSAGKTLGKLFDKDFSAYLVDSGLDKDPRMIKAMYRLHEITSEDSLFPGASLAGTRQKGMLSYKGMD